MKTKSKQEVRAALAVRTKKYVKYLVSLFLFVVILFAYGADAQEGAIQINEIMFNPTGSDTGKEWIEISNKSDSSVFLEGWTMKMRGSSGSNDFVFPLFEFKKDSFLIVHLRAQGIDSVSDIFQQSATGANLGDSRGSVSLYDAAKKIADFIEYGEKGQTFESVAVAAGIWEKDTYVKISEEDGYTIEAIPGKDSNNEVADWQLSFIPGGTPGIENSKEEKVEGTADPEDDPKDTVPVCKDKIILSELFPFAGEFVEVENIGTQACDLAGWKIGDEKNSPREFPADSVIDPGEYVAFTHDFGLNGSSSDSARLFSPVGSEPVEIRSYDKPESGKSYCKDGPGIWKWTSVPTAGKKNEFDAKKEYPNIKLDIDDAAYVNVYADFEIGGLAKDAKVTWNFGDGHRSYRQKTRHRYAAVGRYSASVKFSEGGEDAVKIFTVEVTEIPHPKVSVVAVNANPEGSDTELETLTIANRSKKKINLNGWSVATGWKKLSNHPISGDFVIKPGKKREITREFSKFTLHNEKTKIELRYPDGEVAYAMKYRKKKGGVAEGEIYRKVKGGWEWLAAEQETKIEEQDMDNKQDTITNPPAGGTITNNQTKNNNQESSGTDEVVGIIDVPVRKNKIILSVSRPIANIELLDYQPHYVDSKIVREIDGVYHFTPQFPAPDHYAVVFLKDVSSEMNLKANLLLNYFLN